MSRYLLGLVGFEPSLPLAANQSLTIGPVKHFSASTYSATAIWMRKQDLNLRPLAYEASELPLLHSAIFICSITIHFC